MNTGKPMTILHIFSGDLWAGPEVMIHHLLKQLKEIPGLNIIALALNDGVLTEKLNACGVETLVIPENNHSFFLIYLKALKKLKGKKINIIHAHRPKENLLGLCLKISLNIEHLITTFHGWGVEYFEKKGNKKLRLTTRLDYFIMKHFFSFIIPVSEELKSELEKRYRMRNEKMFAIHNGIDLPPFISNSPGMERRLHVGTVGRLMPQKNFDLFLESASLIREQFPSAKFTILGDGPLRESLNQKSATLGLQNSVEFLPHRPDPFPFYRSLDLYLNTSVFEGIPLTVLEAMACGIPVVASNVGGIPEIISDGESGFLVEELTAKNFAERSLSLLKNKDLRKKIGENGRQRIKSNYSTASMSQLYLRLYHHLRETDRPSIQALKGKRLESF